MDGQGCPSHSYSRISIPLIFKDIHSIYIQGYRFHLYSRIPIPLIFNRHLWKLIMRYPKPLFQTRNCLFQRSFANASGTFFFTRGLRISIPLIFKDPHPTHIQGYRFHLYSKMPIPLIFIFEFSNV